MAAAASAPPMLSPEQPTLDHDDSNVSSPLSDVEDKDGDGSLDGMNLDHEIVEEEASDSDSNLSEANDTEAETERLYDTPQVQRQQNVVMGQRNGDQDLEHTPSKPSKHKNITESGDNNEDDEALSDYEMSVASSQPGPDRSPSKPAKSTEPSSVEDPREAAEGKKRKRSQAVEQSEQEQPLRKRTGSVAAHDPNEHDEDTVMADDNGHTTNPHSGDQSAAEDNATDSARPKRDPSRSDQSSSKEFAIAKKATRNGTRRKSPVIESVDTEEHGEETHEEATADEDAEVPVEDEHADPDAEDDAEGTAKDDEEFERKRAAMEEWSVLEEKFGVFRERLYKDRGERLEFEEKALLADPPTHPEYLNMKRCLDDRLDTKLKHIQKEYEIAIEAHDRLAVARRAEIWTQFYQSVREKREQMLEALNKDWHETQNARRTAHSVPDYGILFPQNPAQRTRNAVAYNMEVSYLAGLAKHEGFPAVPPMRGASSAEIEDDLEAIRRTKPRQRSIMQPLEDYQAVSFGGSLGPAGEQFIKNTPWANPRHISHKLQHSSSHSEAGVGSPLSGSKPHHRQAPVGVNAASVSNGQPGSQKSPPNRVSSASPEMIRSATILSHANQMKRVPSIGNNRGSKAAQEATAKHDAPVAMAG